jgi:peptidoglycan/xylan/chitin deacetylase (PgdA/CDA1 family)
MTQSQGGELVDLKIPIRVPRPIRLSSGRAVAEGLVRLTVSSPSVSEQFTRITGLTAESVPVPLRILAYDPSDSDEIVVRDAIRGLPLIVRRGEEVIACFDVIATQVVRFIDSKRPIYTYIPGFNIQRVPEGVRRPVSNVVQALRSRTKGDVVTKYGALPLTDFEFATLLLRTVAANGAASAQGAFHWPSGKRAVFVSLHDVDTRRLLRRKERSALFRLEQQHRIKSTWFVPSALLNREPHAADFLLESGHEVGWHGHNHDHRDHVGRFAEVAAEALRSSWLSGETSYATGMRAPRLLKTHHLFATLQQACPRLCYDTSFCSGIAPYHLWLYGSRSRLLEIPTTVPTDIRLYNELSGMARQQRTASMVKAQISRTERLIEVGGAIVIVTHPEKSLSERPDFLAAYDEYLCHIKGRTDIWFTTAGELCRYWTAYKRGTTACCGDESGSADPWSSGVRAS